VAYPAQYRSSGVITFVRSQNGGVDEKDLGPQTVTIVMAMATWRQIAAGTLLVAEHADTLVEHLVKNRDQASMKRLWRDVCGT
jgi:hypothetical protein